MMELTPTTYELEERKLWKNDKTTTLSVVVFGLAHAPSYHPANKSILGTSPTFLAVFFFGGGGVLNTLALLLHQKADSGVEFVHCSC
jgi:hypothetical protein